MFDAIGPQHWWPGDTRFEMMVGAMLTQNTSWKNVERAIHNLREADLLDPHALYNVPLAELEELIRPAGYFSREGPAAAEFARISSSSDTRARWTRCFRRSLANCVGNCSRFTASVPRRPTRFCSTRAGCPVSSSMRTPIACWPGTDGSVFDADYHQIQEYIEGELPCDVPMYNEFHALLVRLGKDFCRKANPKCAECPLCELLPPGGPLEPE